MRGPWARAKAAPLQAALGLSGALGPPPAYPPLRAFAFQNFGDFLTGKAVNYVLSRQPPFPGRLHTEPQVLETGHRMRIRVDRTENT